MDKELFDAAIHGHPIIFKRLLDLKADIHAKNRTGHTPLLYAAISGSPEILEALLEKPDINLLDCDDCGDNVLSYTAWYDNHDALKLLLASGAYIDLRIYDINANSYYYGKTPKEIIVNAKRSPTSIPILEAAENLLKLAKTPLPVIEPIETGSSIIESLGPALNARSIQDGNSALHWAILNHNLKLTKALLLGGARVDLRNKQGQDYEKGLSAFDLMIKDKDADPEIKDLIILRKLTQLLKRKITDNQTLIPYQKEFYEIIHLLGSHPCINEFLFDKDTKNPKTPLMHALSQGNFVAAKHLLELPSTDALIKNPANEDAFNYFLKQGGAAIMKEVKEGIPLPEPQENEAFEITQKRLLREIYKLLNAKASKAAIIDAIESEFQASDKSLISVVEDFISKELDENKKQIIYEYIQEQIARAKTKRQKLEFKPHPHSHPLPLDTEENNNILLNEDNTDAKEKMIAAWEKLMHSPILKLKEKPGKAQDKVLVQDKVLLFNKSGLKPENPAKTDQKSTQSGKKRKRPPSP